MWHSGAALRPRWLSHGTSRAAVGDGAAGDGHRVEDVATVAANLANNECERLYGVRPFLPSSWAPESQGYRWSWGRIDPSGPRGYSAVVSFLPDRSAPSVQVYWFKPPIISVEEASTFAAELANNECERIYGERPFTPSSWVAQQDQGDRWKWGREDPNGARGYWAVVSFRSDRTDASVSIHMLPPPIPESGIGSIEEASSLAAYLANEECQRLYGERPFASSSWVAKRKHDRWTWGRFDLNGPRGYSALVSVRPDGTDASVRIFKIQTAKRWATPPPSCNLRLEPASRGAVASAGPIDGSATYQALTKPVID
jgi:hypothetical protein